MSASSESLQLVSLGSPDSAGGLARHPLSPASSPRAADTPPSSSASSSTRALMHRAHSFASSAHDDDDDERKGELTVDVGAGSFASSSKHPPRRAVRDEETHLDDDDDDDDDDDLAADDDGEERWTSPAGSTLPTHADTASSPSSAAESIAASAASSSSLLTILSWASLLVAVVSMSAVGPMFLYLEKRSVAPLLAIVWRQTGQVVFLIPPTVAEFWMNRKEERKWWTLRVHREEDATKPSANAAAAAAAAAAADGANPDSPSSPAPRTPARTREGHSPFYTMFFVALWWGLSLVLWVESLPWTSAARASLFTSVYPLLLLVYYRLRGVRVSLGESAGVLVCLLGIVLSEGMSSVQPDGNTIMAQRAAAESNAIAAFNVTAGANSTASVVDSSSSSFSSSLSLAQMQAVGDVLCLLSAVFIAAEVVLAGPTRKVVPLFAFTFYTSVLVWLQVLVATLILEGSEFSSHPVKGVWGYLASGEMTMRVLLFAFVVGMVGILGFNFSVKYINPIVFSSVQLLDPGISGVLSAMSGVEGWPVTSTYIGVAVVTLGIFLVVYFQSKREADAAKYELIGGGEGQQREEMDGLGSIG